MFLLSSFYLSAYESAEDCRSTKRSTIDSQFAQRKRTRRNGSRSLGARQREMADSLNQQRKEPILTFDLN
jgi:hypothetical protein